MRYVALVLSLSLAACASNGRAPAAQGVAANVDPVSLMSSDRAGYQIGPTDLLQISVFQVPDLSFEEIRVDAAGKLQLPLVGSVQAAGLTADELSGSLQARLAERYLRDPQVSVSIKEAASQKVTVDGAVTKPGVYQMQGRTTLMQAVAMAEGATRVARLGSVAVFRNDSEGRRMVAIFDLAAIRGGQMDDPVMEGDDVVVVDTSTLNVVFREILTALPAVGAFAYF